MDRSFQSHPGPALCRAICDANLVTRPSGAGMDEKGLTVDGTKVSGILVARNKTTRSIQYTQYTHVHTAQVMAFHHVCFMALLFFSLSPERAKGW